MAFETGNANNFADLLNRLISFLTTNAELVAAGQQYQVIFDRTTSYPNREVSGLDRRHVVFRSRGLSGLDEIYTAITTKSNSSLDYYNWRIQGGTGFFDGNLPELVTDLSQGAGLLNPCSFEQVAMFWDSQMPYWFFANGRRWWVVAKVSNINESCGAGFILPACMPSQFRYPLTLWGSTTVEGSRWSDVSNTHGGICTGDARIRMPDGVWQRYSGYQHRMSGVNSNTNAQYLLPTGIPGNQDSSSGGPALDSIYGDLRDNAGGGFSLFPVTLAKIRALETGGTVNSTGMTVGEADGLFWVPAFNSGAEDVIQYNGQNYVCFQSANKSDNPFIYALRAS